MTGLRNQQGVALLAVIFFLVVMAFVGVIFISLSSTNTTQSVSEVSSSRALNIAEGGMERAGRYLLKREGTPPCTTCTCASINGSASFTNTPLGNGQFTITSVFNNNMAPAALSALTTAAATTISVASVAGYAPFGRIMVDKEMIDYTALGTTALGCSPGTFPCFAGAIRGADGTTATSHAAGILVAQTQCLLTSTGGVPTISTGTNQRVVSQAEVVQNGWVVGNPGGIPSQRPFTLGWNGTLWSVQNNAALNIIRALQSVSCLSPVNCWAVGNPGVNPAQRPLTLFWNGTLWSVQNNAALNITQTLWSVYMNSARDGWAVGNPGGVGQRPLILYWNGIAWAVRNTGLPAINQGVNSVYCNSNITPINCWAVGNAGGVAAQQPLILYWNGTTLTWSLRKTVLPAINQNLRSIYCNSASVQIDCWAVGNAGGVAAQQPLILYWNGTTSTWSINKTGLPVINQTLNAVSCINSSDCWAVGQNSGGRPAMVHWNGAAWSDWTPTAPNIGGGNLNSVTMITSGEGWAVSNNGRMIHWDGTSWTVDTQGTTASGGNGLNSVMIIGPKRPNIAWREVPQ